VFTFSEYCGLKANIINSMARVQNLYISNYILEKIQRWIQICKQVPALPTRKHQNAAVLQTSIGLSTTLCLWLYETPLIFIKPTNVYIGSCEKLRITVSQWGEEYPTVTRRKADWTDHILSRNCVLKHVVEGTIEGRREVTRIRRRRRNWVTSRKREDTGNLKRKQWIALYGELAMEEATDLS